jgi:hypothetical protein
MSDQPSGQPYGEAHAPALQPVWCIHKVRFDPNDDGYYVPAEIDALHPDVPCRSVGSIPDECQPTVAYDPAEYPNAGPHGAAAVKQELLDD